MLLRACRSASAVTGVDASQEGRVRDACQESPQGLHLLSDKGSPVISTHCCMLPCPRKGLGEEIGKVGGSTWDAKQERNAER